MTNVTFWSDVFARNLADLWASVPTRSHAHFPRMAASIQVRQAVQGAW